MKLLLDTHAWIWWHMQPDKLSRTAYSLIHATADYEALLISAITPWEFCKLLEKGRLSISCDAEVWLEHALKMPKLRLVSLTPRLSCRSTLLPHLFHDDPADQIIVATAREENATIITKDRRILDYQHVKTAW